MLQQHYLNLQLVRLKPPKEWINKEPGLSFLFLKGGVAICDSGVNTCQLVSGDVLVLNKAGGGKVCASNGDEAVFLSFSLCFEHLFPLFESHEICFLRNLYDVFKEAKRYPASEAVARQCFRLLTDLPPQFTLDHRGQLIRIATVILASEFSNVHRQRKRFVRMEDRMLDAFESLSAADILNLPVGDLANRFGCSRRHLNRLFHQRFGLSVASLKMEMRLLKAMSLLRNPDTKVINVAAECGFNHLGLFSVCFKRRFGTSPGKWRKMPADINTQSDSSGLLEGNPNCTFRANGLCPWSVKYGQPNQPGGEDPSIQPAKFPRGFTSPPYQGLIAGTE